MHPQTPIYFIGWDYHSPGSTALKRLLDHPLSPWRAEAIVHDEVWVPAVDSIPLMTTQRFLDVCRDSSTTIHAVMKIKDALHQKVWQRRAKEFAFTCIDDGEIFQATERHLREVGGSIDLGPLQLHGAQVESDITTIRKYAYTLQDAESNAVLRAYLHYLDTGLTDTLRAASKPVAENPLGGSPSALGTSVAAFETGTAWEIASRRTSFLEQVMLLAGGKARHWRYAFSAQDAVSATREGRNLDAILRSLGIELAASHIDTLAPFRQSSALRDHPVPSFEAIPLVARIDVADPLPLMKALHQGSARCHLLVRAGATPMQLAGILESFPASALWLRCDRPGPLGLQIELKPPSP